VKKRTKRASKQGRRAGWVGLAAALVSSAAICAFALWWFHRHGYLLYYGDALAHLTIARRLFDSRTPGYEQIGTVWLPLPHWIMEWFARDAAWWRTGLAGCIPAAIAQTLAGVFRRSHLAPRVGVYAAGMVGMLLFLLNPSSAYLGSIHDDRAVFACALCALAWSLSGSALGAAGVGALFIRRLVPDSVRSALLPPVDRGSAARRVVCRWRFGPLYWLGHNWALTAIRSNSTGPLLEHRVIAGR
jgi:hypothetical protein